ncbi:glycine C-acetyltransferase [Usitatibacter palustris]|uniref:2-amino-3-ketobutyrate coenzyme A ligase n=1 Tax=Usitatibacter palustris TaxID=2732487 RepID=A0A6M4H7R7_9PROT|nr:glycine C-acetyltransferase [Usitatibacter palustris]QJR15412.1 2-amino-3-ketobutyrate coenzyme A ligase [Usitatibacter palustris]
MQTNYLTHIREQLAALETQGLYKHERVIASPQSARIEVTGGAHVLNFCANNYLGLANHSALVAAAKSTLDEHGYGMASVRFICGTQTVHRELEAKLAQFLGTEDAILYGSCFDANGGLFETLLGEEDAVISDALNHASIIDGVRLSKAKRFRYANNDMADLEAQLKSADAEGARFKMIATDGVFSMDGILANLKAICDLADKYQAMVMVDDSHAVGFVGAKGRGTHEHCGVMGRVDILTGTLGKALGGASGGYTAGPRDVIAWLRNRSRPYLFSNTLMPAIAGASLKVLELLEQGDALRTKLAKNAAHFRKDMTALGFKLAGAGHPIIPVMLGDAPLAKAMADRLLAEGIYVIGFSFPVVPKGQARIRTQMSAAHEPEHIESAVVAFAKVGRELGVIK